MGVQFLKEFWGFFDKGLSGWEGDWIEWHGGWSYVAVKSEVQESRPGRGRFESTAAAPSNFWISLDTAFIMMFETKYGRNDVGLQSCFFENENCDSQNAKFYTTHQISHLLCEAVNRCRTISGGEFRTIFCNTSSPLATICPFVRPTCFSAPLKDQALNYLLQHFYVL